MWRSVFILFILLAGCQSGVGRSASPGRAAGLTAAPVSRPESKAWSAFARARLWLAEGELINAVAAFEEARDTDPASRYLRHDLARLYSLLGRHSAAIEEIEEALEYAPEDPDLKLHLGRLLIRQKLWARAARLLSEAISATPDYAPAYLQLSICYQNLNQPARATDTIKRLLKLYPESLPGHLQLARLYLQQGLPRLAEQVFRQLLATEHTLPQVHLGLARSLRDQDKGALARESLAQGLRQFPDSRRLLHGMVQSLVDERQWDQALEYLDSLARLSPEDGDIQRRIGLILMEKKLWPEAETALLQALRMTPTKASLHYYLGLVYEQQQRWDEADITLAEIPASDRLYPDALFHRAFLAQQRDDAHNAIQLLEKRLTFGQKSADHFDFLASLWEQIKDPLAALNALDRGLEEFPLDTELLYHRGMLLDRQGEREQALATMRMILQLNADHTEALNFLAYFLAEQDRELDLALEMVTRAMQQEPKPHILDTYAWVLYRLGRLEDARLKLEEVVQTLIEDAVVWQHLGDVYRDLGRLEDARNAYEQALQQDPENAAELKSRLRQLDPVSESADPHD